MEAGFSQSPLKLNEGLGACEQWNEREIILRADKLANKAISIWKIPSLSEDILENYKEKKQYTPTEWTIEDHPFLTNEYNRELFDALRKEIQGLDECVREEFLKKYVAYKAETNFIDVIPLTKKLRLILNMNFIEINDPRAFCRDIAGLGCWGTEMSR